MIIAMGTKNPTKIAALTRVAKLYLPEANITSVNVPSDVSVQPMSDKETLQGAENRARNALSAVPDAEYGVGLEGGIHQLGDEMYLIGWAVIINSKGQIGRGGSARIALPKKVAQEILTGKELADVMATRIGRDALALKTTNGTFGELTDDKYTRSNQFEHALVMAFAPLTNKFYK